MSDKKKTGVDIPTLKKKEEKEQKGGGFVVGQGSGSSGGVLARWLGAGARPAASSLSKGALGVARVGAPGMRLGLMPQFINFASSNFGMAVLTVALTGGSVFTLFTLGGRKPAPEGGKAPLFGARSSAASEAEISDPARPGSINFFASANQGRAFQDGAAAAVGVEEAVTSEDVEEAGADAAAEAGDGPILAEELMENLEKPHMIASKGFGQGAAQALGSGVGLAGGSGMAGGVNRQFNQRPMKEGVLSKPSPAGRKLTARRTAQALKSVGGKGSMKQLRFANRHSVKAMGRSSAEGQAFQAAEAFDTAPAAAGSDIGGAGLGAGEGGAGASASPAVDDGGPLGAGEERGEEDVKKVGQSKDKAPYTGMVMMAQALLMAASTIIAIIGILAKVEKIAGPFSGYVTGMKMAFYAMALAMAAAATAMGVMIMTQYGQQTQGMILTVGGGLTTAFGAMALMNWDNNSTGTWLAIIGGVAGLAASVGSLLAPGSGLGFGEDNPGGGSGKAK